MANAWLEHLAEVRRASRGLSLKDAMKKAKGTYKKHPKKGQASRSRKGRQDFVTHKGDKDFNVGNKRQRKSRKPYNKHPKKGQPSRTRKGKLDFVTHKGDKCFNVGNKRQCKKRRPYQKK